MLSRMAVIGDTHIFPDKDRTMMMQNNGNTRLCFREGSGVVVCACFNILPFLSSEGLLLVKKIAHLSPGASPGIYWYCV